VVVGMATCEEVVLSVCYGYSNKEPILISTIFLNGLLVLLLLWKLPKIKIRKIYELLLKIQKKIQTLHKIHNYLKL